MKIVCQNTSLNYYRINKLPNLLLFVSKSLINKAVNSYGKTDIRTNSKCIICFQEGKNVRHRK